MAHNVGRIWFAFNEQVSLLPLFKTLLVFGGRLVVFALFGLEAKET